ncbi:MAG: radical SAM protein [Acutalibacteraceae bacterium]|nr:radical SAM protein [Acutalibacteraceae bacterium]
MENLCSICPRNCKVLRNENSGTGFCKMGLNPVVARVSKHMWEEPCISGTEGSGTVFFSGCVMKCVFCQNYKISTQNFGKVLTPSQLADCYKSLEEQGVNNINLVTPTHFVQAITKSLDIYKPKIPVVYNCGGYESVDTLKSLEGYIDIYLPDFKYADSDLAKKYSNATDYPEIAIKAIKEMYRQQPKNIFDKNGIMKNGIIIRHLVLPGNTKNSVAVIKLIKENFGCNIPVSLMAQYTPYGVTEKYPEINRKVTKREYKKVVEFLENTELDGFVQELSSATDQYIPDFNLQGIAEKNL